MTATYPRYSVWSDHERRVYEIVRWDTPKAIEIVQTNIRTYEKAHQALADWNARAANTGKPSHETEPNAPVTVRSATIGDK